MKLASTVVLVRASHFGANPETAPSNTFQATCNEPNARKQALHEQALLADLLEESGVNVIRLEPPRNSCSPDGVFPNNWFSTHEDGRLVLYPMEAPSRRSERIPDLAEQFRDNGFCVKETVDLTGHAKDGRFLEGTGSLVLDRGNRIAYACTSSRTDRRLATEWAGEFGYQLCWFVATDTSGQAVYHTNVVMSLGAGLAVVCFEAVREPEDRERLRQTLKDSGLEILVISWEQVRAFAGNQLFLQGRGGAIVALSATADAALSPAQKAVLDRHAARCIADIATIERHGGGSVRCMLAEIFLPRND